MTNPNLSVDRIPVSSALDEETARAEVYGLLAQLYYAPPAAELLDALRVAATEAPAPGAFLEEPWRELVGMARQMTCEGVDSEYQALFGGVGKPEVYLFGSHYLSGFLNDKPLARLRTDLAGLGLARDEAITETEDHIACLCEVMRYLIAGDDVAVANLSRQRDFFATHVQSWVPALCDTLAGHPAARFYAALAGFTRAFVSVEAQGFDMLA
jgi:TorA maturation chaperone TorD